MTDEHDSETQSPEYDKRLPPIPKPPNAIQDLPEEQREEIFQYFREVVHVEQTTGLMPPPSMLSAYSPDVQRIIVDEFAQHGRHRRNSEGKVMDASIQRDKRGMWLGFSLAMTLILCGTGVILAGFNVEGLAVVASAAGALAVVYIVDQRSRSK